MSFSGDVSLFSCSLINQPVPVSAATRGKGEQELGAPDCESEATGQPAHIFTALILLFFDSSFNQLPFLLMRRPARCLLLAGKCWALFVEPPHLGPY